jgi:hypothetical protein
MVSRFSLILLAVSLNVLTGLFSRAKISPFIFYDVEISIQHYFYYAFTHVSIILIWWFCLLETKYKDFFRGALLIEVFALIDYLVIYEKSFMDFGGLHLEFTHIKILLYGLLILNEHFKK